MSSSFQPYHAGVERERHPSIRTANQKHGFNQSEKMTDIDPELAEAIVPEAAVPASEDAAPEAATFAPADDAPVPVSRSNNSLVAGDRRGSTMGVAGIESVLKKAMKDRDMDKETRDLVSGCVKDIDRDHDGRIDHWELVNFAINLTKQVQKLKKKNFSLKVWFQIAVGVCLFLVLSTFASSTAAVFMAKDMYVENNNALVTKDNQAIKTTTNEVEATVGALAFLPDEARKHVKSVTFRGDGSDGDEVIYEKLVGSIVVHPKESVVLTTTEGDTLKWSLANNKDGIKITLANGESWLMGSGCEKCTILNLLQDEEVTRALDEYHETIGTVLHERGRVLHDMGCNHVHDASASITCDLPDVFKPSFLLAKTKIEARIQSEVTTLLEDQGLDVPLKKLLDEIGKTSSLPTFNTIFNMTHLLDKVFEGVDGFIDGASDIGTKFHTNLQTHLTNAGGTFNLEMACSTNPSNTTWTMGMKIMGTLPSLASGLNNAGVGSELQILPLPLPALNIAALPDVKVDYELNIPLALDIGASPKEIVMRGAYAKILTRLDAQMALCLDLSSIPKTHSDGSIDPLGTFISSAFSGNVNLKGGFRTQAQFDFQMSPLVGQYNNTSSGVSYTGGGGTVTASGGYNAEFVLPMPEDETPVTFDRSIALRATDNNMFDDDAMPCVNYEFNSCGGYACNRWGPCIYDMCDWIEPNAAGTSSSPSLDFVLDSAGMSSTCAASTLQAPAAPAANVCTS